MEASATILVIAGTGHQGSAVMDTILSSPLRKGIDLRFMTRWPESTYAKKYISQGAQAYVGDLSDEDSVVKALQGVDRAFLVTHAAEGASSEKVHGIHFVQAAKQAGVKHIVFTSAAGVELESDVPSFKAKWQIEDYLHKSGLEYTTLRPCCYMNIFETRPGFHRWLSTGMFFAAAGHKKVKLIAVKDIGIIAGKALLNPDDPRFYNATLTLAGGDYDIKDLRQAFKTCQGKEPWFATHLPEAVAHWYPEHVRRMILHYRHDGFPEVNYEKLKEIHPDLQTFEDYVREHETGSAV